MCTTALPPVETAETAEKDQPACTITPDYARAYLAFVQNYPSFLETSAIDALRAAEYSRLDRLGQVYLDYTGGGLHADCQVRAHQDLLAHHVFGNPHSNNPTSMATTALVERARAFVLEFFNVSPDEYGVVFTPNASGALKVLGESYPFGPGSRYLPAYDNHNSVNGIREFARRRGAKVTYLPVEESDLRLNPESVRERLMTADRDQHNLFAFPAQSNFSGVQHPLEWVKEAQEFGWDVLLDCAAFAPTNRLDLGVVKPDFIPLSFYKMFGYPTGVGALIARRPALAKLQRPWFAGGTITIASVQGEGWHYLIPGEAGFEDGTVNYLSLPAVEIGLRHLHAVGIDRVHTRVTALTGWLLAQMTALRHSNGQPVVHIFGPQTTDRRGGTIAFYFVDPLGQPFDVRRVEAMAGQERISLRTGCFCNPGDGEIAHHLQRGEMGRFAGPAPVSYAQFYQLIHDQTGKTPSTIRVSLGLASNFADVYSFMHFAAAFRDRHAGDILHLFVDDRHHAPDTA